jgi:hypothetical protein
MTSVTTRANVFSVNGTFVGTGLVDAEPGKIDHIEVVKGSKGSS